MTAQTQPKAQKTYDITLIFDASKSVSVQATSVEEAIYLASDQVGTPSLCHQCYDEIELGDCTHEIVYLDGEEVEDTDYRVKTISKLKERIAQLEAENALVMQEASSLARSLFTQHFSQDEHYASGAVVWELCDSLRGVLSQIDNMSTALVRSRPALSDEQIRDVVWGYVEDSNNIDDHIIDIVRATERAHGIGEPT